MSHHEHGTIRIPTSAWIPLRRRLNAAANDHAEACFKHAVRTYGILSRAPAEGGRGKAFLLILLEALGTLPANIGPGERERIRQSVATGLTGDHADARLRSPKRCDFPKFGARAEAFELDIDGIVTLNVEAKSIEWTTFGNAATTERARRHPVARELFESLANTAWTRGSGGELFTDGEVTWECGLAFKSKEGTSASASSRFRLVGGHSRSHAAMPA